jgi:hypothetical protein
MESMQWASGRGYSTVAVAICKTGLLLLLSVVKVNHWNASQRVAPVICRIAYGWDVSYFCSGTLKLGDNLLKHALTAGALVLTTALIASWGPLANADQAVYRWKDTNGNLVNSDRPPPQGVDYEVISTKSSMVRPVDAEEGAVPLEVKPTATNKFEQVDTSKPPSQKNPEFCKRAKENLAALDTNARIRMRNEEGEVRYLTPEEKEAEKNKALDTIKATCE